MTEAAVEQPFEEYFSCSICLNVVSLDMSECGKCSKLNCRTCINDWTKKQPNCPNCRNEYKPSEQPNLYVANRLKDFNFKCPKCGQSFMYRHQLRHENECSARRLQCPLCQLEDLPVKDVSTHLAEQCPKI